MERSQSVLVADTHCRKCRIARGQSTERRPVGSWLRNGAEPRGGRRIRFTGWGLFPILSRSRNQDAALSPFQTNAGLFGSLGWAAGDAPHDAWASTRDGRAWAPPIALPVFPGLKGRGDANSPDGPQAATSAGANVGSLASANQPSDQLWESVSIPLAQAQFPFEGGSEPVPTARKSVDAAECNAMHERDLFHCRMVGLPACYAQANLRLANCLAGKQIPPLNY